MGRHARREGQSNLSRRARGVEWIGVPFWAFGIGIGARGVGARGGQGGETSRRGGAHLSGERLRIMGNPSGMVNAFWYRELMALQLLDRSSLCRAPARVSRDCQPRGG